MVAFNTSWMGINCLVKWMVAFGRLFSWKKGGELVITQLYQHRGALDNTQTGCTLQAALCLVTISFRIVTKP